MLPGRRDTCEGEGRGPGAAVARPLGLLPEASGERGRAWQGQSRAASRGAPPPSAFLGVLLWREPQTRVFRRVNKVAARELPA